MYIVYTRETTSPELPDVKALRDEFGYLLFFVDPERLLLRDLYFLL